MENLNDLLPWSEFVDVLGENIQRVGDPTPIPVVLWYRDDVNEFGQRYQWIEFETDVPFTKGQLITLDREKHLTPQPQYRVTREIQSAYANSNLYVASEERI